MTLDEITSKILNDSTMTGQSMVGNSNQRLIVQFLKEKIAFANDTVNRIINK